MTRGKFLLNIVYIKVMPSQFRPYYIRIYIAEYMYILYILNN